MNDDLNNLEALQGGNSNDVFLNGDTVIRNTGVWSPFVHQFLQYLTQQGFDKSPIFIEANAEKERLSYIKGEIGHYPLKPYMMTDKTLVESANLLREFHDISQNFTMPPNSQFFAPSLEKHPYEVICHNDFAPYNLVFRDEHIAGIIDFDTSAPATRIWDVAYAVYRFAPLVTDEHCYDMGWEIPPNRVERLKLFCDSYGLDDRTRLIDTVIERLQTLIQYIEENSTTLEHLSVYNADIVYIQDNKILWDSALRT
ncbi:MAG: aminoglycoside phosphotransferase family protein [Phototrophicaceae bacterium]